MSHGHHAQRRRNYGRRQHELRERRLRRETWEGFEVSVEDVDEPATLELFDAMRPRGSRVFDLLTPRSRWLAEAG